MTKKVLFIQGGGNSAHDDWDDKLVASLARDLGPNYDIRYPRMPNEAEPRYSAWKRAIAREISRLDKGAIIVGHSLGGAMLIHAVAGDPPKQKLAGIFLLAAPFIGPGGWPSEDIKASTHLGARLPDTAIFLYHGTNDETAPVAHVALYAAAIPQARVRRLEGRDHQLNNDLSEVAADIRALAQ
jgi:predicted alpha/beta hydrolase family esterase